MYFISAQRATSMASLKTLDNFSAGMSFKQALRLDLVRVKGAFDPQQWLNVA
jgi:hypothetical protein